jgi:hypothetical protein
MGFDFGMWRDLQQTVDERNWDEIALTKSSVYGAGVAARTHPQRDRRARLRRLGK